MGMQSHGVMTLLDSSASHHFTGDLHDFASDQKLKHEHYAKMANGVALIAGIDMVLLQHLDHNTGIENVIKLSQVLHMPEATAHLISMSEMLCQNYKVTSDKHGISLIEKGDLL